MLFIKEFPDSGCQYNLLSKFGIFIFVNNFISLSKDWLSKHYHNNIMWGLLGPIKKFLHLVVVCAPTGRGSLNELSYLSKNGILVSRQDWGPQTLQSGRICLCRL